MKRYLIILTTLALIAALLAGCGSAPAQTVQTAESEQTATSEPPSTVPDPTPAPEKNGMYDLLGEVFDNYHAGTAGSSLRAAWYAASIVDWGVKNGPEALRAGAAAWDRGLETEFGESFEDKLSGLYSIAMTFYGPGKGILSDCGWEGEWTYTGGDVRSIFSQIWYTVLGSEPPFLLRVFYPDDQAERLLVSAAAIEDGTESREAVINGALQAAGVYSPDAGVLTAELDGDVLHLDMNAAFAEGLRSLGSAGEQLTMNAVVNTALDLVSEADSVLFTVEGQPLETGHDVYDYPMTFFEE